jgi:hypothetical protein
MVQALVGGDGITLQDLPNIDEIKPMLLLLKPSQLTRGLPCCRVGVGIWTPVTLTLFMINLKKIFAFLKLSYLHCFSPWQGGESMTI